jgi:eukaryotic-like serine/threonine-protein kinase
MSPEKWHEISKIFNIALELKSSERAIYLDKICGDNPDFRREIESLLDANDQKDSFIDSPKLSLTTRNNSLKLKPDDKIGSFQIVKSIGSGGMGEVYLAKDLRLNRNVALKFLTLSDDNSNRRFLREAQSAAALEHSHICTIHEIAQDEGREFIVMQYVEGETLAARIKRQPLKIQEALEIALQVADALSEAHSRQIIHRDIKPANIIIAANNQVKVLDFGLAKRITFSDSDESSSFKTLLSSPGVIMGTVSYMSPEQVRGREADLRCDLWSLGVVLYEMVTGKLPFSGENSVEKLAAILYQEPEIKPEIPKELAAILDKSLQKEPQNRYQNSAELIADLRSLKQELDFEEQLLVHVSVTSGEGGISEKISQYLSEHPTIELKSETKKLERKNNRKWVIVSGLAVVIITLGGYFLWQNYRLDYARQNLKKIADSAAAEKYFEAYDLAVETEKLLPNDEILTKLLPTISDTLSVNSNENGAKVFLTRYGSEQRQLIGETPLNDLRIARGHYVLEIEKDGFENFERTISGIIPSVGGSFIASPPLKIEVKLLEKGKIPPRMVYVSGGEYSLVNWSRPTEKKVNLSEFFIDKFEVTNAEYKQFITGGGYVRPELWKIPFSKDGKEVAMLDALKLLKDRTGLPAPRSWANQTYPDGKANFPVTDITWYEAAAYAEFRGKKLPTVFQWEKAARDGAFDPRYNAMPWGFIKQGETIDKRANFRGTDTVAVETNEFGMSPFGAYNMAGNVSEWNRNQSPDGFVTSGGAWNDLAYAFGDYGEYPGFYQSNRIGFRCVLVADEKGSDDGGQMLPPAETPEYKPSSESDFKRWLSHYEYDKVPLNTEILEVSETADWRKEKISFTGEGGEKAIAYLYLPKNAAAPFQVLHYVPPGDVVRGIRNLPDSIEMFAAPFIKSGRAVFGVVLKGYPERPFPPNYAPPENSSIEFRKQMVNWITDFRRGVDYLESREDIDKQRLGFWGISNGANIGLILTAVENRYKSLAFISAGLEKDFRNRIAETSPINLASQIKTQKLVVNGRFDETFPYNTDAKPLFKLLREPKKIVLYEGGHIPTPDFYIPTTNDWFDETMGRVAR